MRVGIYVRVSTNDQAEEGYSIDEQIDKLKKYCEVKDWPAPTSYVDAGFSGSNLKRPGITKLIRDVKDHKIDTILVYKLDRLSRSQKDTLYLIEDVFNKYGAAFISLQENFDTSTAFGKAMIGILSVFAQLEREQIKERMMMGKLGRIKSGKPSAWSVIPFGYKYEDGKLIIDPLTAPIVKRIYNDYMAGISITKLKDYLNEEGHIGKDVEWSYATISYILSSPTYAGYTVYQDKLFDGEQEPIVSKEYFEKTQKELKIRQQQAYKRNNNPRPFQAKYMLSGLLRCGYCGSSFEITLGMIRKDGTRFRRYRCYSKSSKKHGGTHTRSDHGCPSTFYDMEPLQNRVLDQIEKLRINPQLIGNSPESTYAEQKALKKRISSTDKKLEKLVELYLDESLPLDVLNQKKEKIQNERSSLVAKLKELESDEKELSVHEAVKLLDKTPADIHTLDYKTQCSIVRQLISKIVITADTMQIYWRFD